MPTIRDIAEMAGVSTATVSHVINNTRTITPETRSRVERVIAETQFVPNPVGRLLAQQRSGVRAATFRPAFSTLAFTPSSDVAHNSSSNPGQANIRAQTPSSVASPVVAAAAMFNKVPEPLPTAEADSSTTTRALLKTIRAAQPVSRAELARRLRVNRSTVTEIVRPLLEAGALTETMPDAAETRIGRPPIWLSLASAHTYFIGVNIGVRQSQVGLAQTNNRMLGESSFDTPDDPTEALALIRSSVLRLRDRIPPQASVFIGVSVPGPVDAARTRLVYAPHLGMKGWRDVAVADALRDIVPGSPGRDEAKIAVSAASGVSTVVVENDATAAAVYESRRRLRDSDGDDWNDFVLVRAGTGIGVGLVRGGKIYRGIGVDSGLAGEFGHMTIVAGGKSCACGNRGCWERYASASSAAALYAGDRPTPGGSMSAPSFVEIVARAEAGERRAQATLESTGEYLGIGIGNLISGLGVTRVVVSGRIVYGWKFLADSLRQAVRRTMAGRLTRWSVEAGEARGAGLGGALEVAVVQHLIMLAAQSKAK